MSSSDDEFAQIRIADPNQSTFDCLSNSCAVVNDLKCNEVVLKCYDDRYDTSPEYLAQLLSDKKKLQNFPGLFAHLEKLLEEEIVKVRRNLFHLIPSKLSRCLPNPSGPTITLSEKLSVPVNEYPDYNFVGRILGPRGRTAKQLEQDMDCKIMIRGKGSTRNVCKMLEGGKSKQYQEHQNDDLHILISVEDAENRAKLKLQMAVEQVKKLLVPAAEGEDSLKKKQLMELAIINGTYRETRSSSLSPSSSLPKIINGSQILGRTQLAIHNPSMGLLTPTQSNPTPIILAPTRVPVPISPSTNSGVINGCIQRTPINGQPIIGSGFLNGIDSRGGILVQFDPNMVQPTFIDLAYSLDSSQAGPLRRGKLNMRDQPYLR